MNNLNSQAVDQLNELLERNYDAEKGYKKAFEDVESVELKEFFESYAQQRYYFGHEIKDEITKLGGEPQKGSSVQSGIHRTWIDVKSFFTGKDEASVLAECERGEKASLEDYQKVLRNGQLPADTQMVLSRQHDQIQAAVDRIHSLKAIFDARR